MLPYATAPPASHRLKLEEGAVHVWLIDVTVPGDTQLTTLEKWLSPDEIARIQRYRRDIDRRRDIVCRALLRQLLCRYLGLYNAQLSLDRTENGKPLLASNPAGLQFNYSHSGDYAAFAFVLGPEVGIDIEYSLRSNDLLAISSRFFSASEVADLAALPEQAHRERFFAYWTLKEAYIKARGEGIFIGLDNFSFHLTAQQEQPAISFSSAGFDSVSGWQFFQLANEDAYPVAVALRDESRSYQLSVQNSGQLYV